MDTLMRRFRKVTIRNNDRRETFFRSERVPMELMYTDFVYGPRPMIPNSEVTFDAAKRFDALEPLDPKLWNQELMRRDEWFKNWFNPNKAPTTHRLRLPRHTGRADRLARARFQAYGDRT